MSVSYWPEISRHCSKTAKEHIAALDADFDALDEAVEVSHSRIEKLPKLLRILISQGISQGIGEALSIGHPLNLSSECDRQLLQDVILKHIERQAAAKARDRIPLNRYDCLGQSYKDLVDKIHQESATRQKKRAQRSEEEEARAQDHQTVKTHHACPASAQEEQEALLAKEVTHDDQDEDEAKGGDENKAEVEDEAKGQDEAEEEADENDVTKVYESNMPQEQSVNIDAYDPDKRPEQHEPLAHTSGIIFEITSQAVINVLYDMSPTLMRNAVYGAIKKKVTHTQNFLGTSYLSDVSLSESGDICAVTHNEKKEDMFLLSQMTGWDMDIIDHDICTNFGTNWRYRVHMKGFNKESSLSWDLGPRTRKAALISELVRTNATTLTSLRIHHIKDVQFSRGPDAEEVLAVDFFDIEQARAAISRGLCYKGVRYECQSLEKQRFLARCNHCQAVGHPTNPHCGPPRCGSCSAGHQTKDCPMPSQERCALCGGPHASYNSDCPVTKVETNSVWFNTAPTRETQLMMHPEKRKRKSHCVCGLDSNTPKLLTEVGRLRQSVQGMKASLKARRGNNKTGKTKKRRALEPLVNSAPNNAGRSTKRIKIEEQQEKDTNDLYRTPSPYIVHRD